MWLQDSNVINVSSSGDGDAVGAEITVRHPGGAATRTIRHIGETGSMMFSLDDALAALFDDNIGEYTCQADIYLNGSLFDTLAFAFQLLDGKSFTNRSHAIARTIYIYDLDEVKKLQIYSPGGGSLNIGGLSFPLSEGLNQYDLSGVITGDGTYTACLTGSGRPVTAAITGDVPRTPSSTSIYWSSQGGGSLVEVFPFCHSIVVDCSCVGNDFVELRYRDADGCYRNIGGKLVKEVNKASSAAYTRTLAYSCYRNIPRRKITGTSRVVTVGFSDMATDAYIQDIRYSEDIWMRMWNGEWWPVALNNDGITVRGDQDTQDVELEIIISEE